MALDSAHVCSLTNAQTHQLLERCWAAHPPPSPFLKTLRVPETWGSPLASELAQVFYCGNSTSSKAKSTRGEISKTWSPAQRAVTACAPWEHGAP